MTSPIVLTPKGASLDVNTSFEPFSVRISATVWSGRVIEKKGQYNNKVTKVLHFPYLGEAPTGPIRPWSCKVGDVRDVITCAMFQIEIFMGYDFTAVEFSIFLLIFAWALQQCLLSWVTLYYLAKDSMRWSFAGSVWDSWASWSA